jgi:hypothetical protein
LALLAINTEVKLWNKNIESAYDIFDIYKPDIFITKYDNISKDILNRISEEENVLTIIRCFNENEEREAQRTIKNCKVLSRTIQPCNIFMDNLISDSKDIKYEIESLYIISQDSDMDKLIVKPSGSYHIIGLKECDSVDIVMSIGSIYSIAKNYKKVHVLIDNCEHIAMDFCILGNEVFYHGKLFPTNILKTHTPYDLLCSIFQFKDNIKTQIENIKLKKFEKILLPKVGILEIKK